MTMETLIQLIPQLLKRVQVLEKYVKQSKEVMGNAIVKLVRKFKKLETVIKKKGIAITESEPEDVGEENSSK